MCFNKNFFLVSISGHFSVNFQLSLSKQLNRRNLHSTWKPLKINFTVNVADMKDKPAAALKINH